MGYITIKAGGGERGGVGGVRELVGGGGGVEGVGGAMGGGGGGW